MSQPKKVVLKTRPTDGWERWQIDEFEQAKMDTAQGMQEAFETTPEASIGDLELHLAVLTLYEEAFQIMRPFIESELNKRRH